MAGKANSVTRRQRQRGCSLLGSKEQAAGLTRLGLLRVLRSRCSLLLLSFPWGELGQGGHRGSGSPPELPHAASLQHPTSVAFGVSVAAPVLLAPHLHPFIPSTRDPLGAKWGNGVFPISVPLQSSELPEMSLPGGSARTKLIQAHSVLGRILPRAGKPGFPYSPD